MTTVRRLFEAVHADPEVHSTHWDNEWSLKTREGLGKIWETLKVIPRTEYVAAQAIHSNYRNHVSYVEADDTWYVWDGRIHQPESSDAVALHMVDVFWSALCKAIDEAEYWIGENPDAETQKQQRAALSKHKIFRDSLTKNSGRLAMVAQLKYMHRVDNDHFLDDRRWFVVRNGVFDMDEVNASGEFILKPHDPRRSVYRMFDAEYEEDADYPALKQFLSGSIADDSQARYFSKAVAWAMLGAPKSTRTVLSIQGAPSSGKSMLLDSVRRLAPAFVADPPEDAITLYGKNPKHARYEMRNARLSGFSEVRSKINHTFLLEYSGGDMLKIEQKYVNGSSVKPQGIIMIANNTALAVDKSDPAMVDRLAIVSFPWSFRKGDPEHPRDETLGDRIVAEASGFLSWMVWSYKTFLKEGLDRSDSMMALLREEAEDEDTVSTFLSDRIDSGRYRSVDGLPAIKSVRVSDLHADYAEWCGAHKVDKRDFASLPTFKTSLEALGYSLRKASVLRVLGLEENANVYGLPKSA